MFSAGFVLGMLGTCISAYLNGYATSPDPGADHNFLTQPSRPGRNFFTPAKPPGHKPSLLARSSRLELNSQNSWEDVISSSGQHLF